MHCQQSVVWIDWFDLALLIQLQHHTVPSLFSPQTHCWGLSFCWISFCVIINSYVALWHVGGEHLPSNQLADWDLAVYGNRYSCWVSSYSHPIAVTEYNYTGKLCNKNITKEIQFVSKCEPDQPGAREFRTSLSSYSAAFGHQGPGILNSPLQKRLQSPDSEFCVSGED